MVNNACYSFTIARFSLYSTMHACALSIDVVVLLLVIIAWFLLALYEAPWNVTQSSPAPPWTADQGIAASLLIVIMSVSTTKPVHLPKERPHLTD